MLSHQSNDADSFDPTTAAGGLLDTLDALRKTTCLRAMTLPLRIWCAMPSCWIRRTAR